MSLNFKLLGLLTLMSAAQLQAAMNFATSPDPRLTPGAFCDRPDSYRFREKIAYCERDVETSLKKEIIAMYDEKLGTRIQSMNRADFKIDHLIPLCIGGSNDIENLWPQHKSTFNLTDPIEHKTCELVGKGTLRRNEAVEFVGQSEDPSQALKILDKLNSL